MHLVEKHDFSICDLLQCDLLLPWPHDTSSVVVKKVLCTIDLAANTLKTAIGGIAYQILQGTG